MSRNPARDAALAGLTPDQLAATDLYFGRTRFEAGQYVLREGEHDRSFYIVTAGEVDVLVSSGAGEPPLVRTLTPPEMFGEIAFFDAGIRSASVRGRTDGALDRMSYEAFLALADEDPQIGTKLSVILGASLARRLRAIEARQLSPST